MLDWGVHWLVRRTMRKQPNAAEMQVAATREALTSACTDVRTVKRTLWTVVQYGCAAACCCASAFGRASVPAGCAHSQQPMLAGCVNPKPCCARPRRAHLAGVVARVGRFLELAGGVALSGSLHHREATAGLGTAMVPPLPVIPPTNQPLLMTKNSPAPPRTPAGHHHAYERCLHPIYVTHIHRNPYTPSTGRTEQSLGVHGPPVSERMAGFTAMM